MNKNKIELIGLVAIIAIIAGSMNVLATVDGQEDSPLFNLRTLDSSEQENAGVSIAYVGSDSSVDLGFLDMERPVEGEDGDRSTSYTNCGGTCYNTCYTCYCPTCQYYQTCQSPTCGKIPCYEYEAARTVFMDDPECFSGTSGPQCV
jgi:hypothetical protein